MRIYGLTGRSLRHSFSKEYFTRRFQSEGIADSEYRLFEVQHASDIPKLFAEVPGLSGLNVTIPYKQEVIPYLDRLDPSAREVGAVNTISLGPSGELIGHNTDIVGFSRTLRPLVTPAVERAMILGTGGAALAVRHVIQSLGVRTLMVGRREGSGDITYPDLTPAHMASHLLIVNATPVGQFPATEEFPDIPYHALTPQHILIDLIYNPSETSFLRKGREAGALTENGLSMLYSQADAAWQIWNEG